MSRRSLSPLLFAAAVVASSGAAAQDAADASSQGLEEVVVTAQKRAESLQDTPIAITAISGDQLQQFNRDDVAAIASQTPSLAYSEAGGESQIYIRGVGSNLFSVGADPSVAINLDGIYLGRSNMGLTQFLDVERVEVLRGPQGTLYGRNATGGAINIYSRMPTESLEGYGSVIVGSDERREMNAAVGGPLSDNWSFRLAVRGLKDDGYTDNLDPSGGKIDDNDLQAMRGVIRFAQGAFTATLIGDYSEFDGGNTSIKPVNDGIGLAQSAGAVVSPSVHETRLNFPSFLIWQTGGITANVDWEISDALSLTATLGYREWDSDFLFNTDGTEIEVTRTTQIYDTSQYSAELRLNGEHGWGKWIAGAYWLDEDKFGGLGLVRAGFTNALANRPPAIIPSTTFPPRTFVFLSENEGRASAVFGQLDFELTEQWTLTAGVRWSEEDKDDSTYFVTLLPDTELLGLFSPRPLPARPSAPGPTNRIDSESWSAFTPKVGVQWQPAPEQLYYLSWSKGFKSGGYNAFQTTNPVYDPEFIKATELGAKTQWLDDRLRLNGSVFHYDYSDLQVSTFLNSLTLTTNAAEATIKGVEVELQALPVDNLELQVAATFLDAKYDSFTTVFGSCNAANQALDPRCAGRVGQPRLVDASGKTLNNAPEFKGTFSANYTIPLAAGGRISVFGQVSHQGEVFFNADNSASMTQDSYTLVDARIGYETESGAFAVALFAKNLTDEEYFHNIVQFTSTSDTARDIFNVGHALGYPAPGRQWGLELRYNFGR
jgi:iron complex outermembrane receptor protein